MANGMFAGGIGTSVDPYLIEDPADLDAIRRNPTACYKLINNINLGIPPYCIGRGWQPIDGFIGQLDGNGKKIINLYINRPESDNVGFFGYSGNLTIGQFQALVIKSLGFENAYVKGHNQVAILYGYICRNADGVGFFTAHPSPNGGIYAVYATGKVEANANAAGIIGWFYPGYISGNVLAGFNHLLAAVDLVAVSAGTVFSGIVNMAVVGLGWPYYTTGAGSCSRCVSLCTFSTILTGDKEAYSISNNTCFESFHDNTLWRANGAIVGVTGGSTAITTEEFLNLSSKLTQLKDQMIDGINIFCFKHGKYPSLWFANRDCYFVRIGIGYYTYNTDLQQWVKQFDVIPSTAEVLKVGMASLHQIDTNAWNKLKSYDKVDLINYVEPKERLNVSYAKENLPLQTNQQADKKLCYSREILFADFNNDIVSVAP